MSGDGLRIVGVYRKKISAVYTERRKPPTRFLRCYVVLAYGDEDMGKLAISDAVYDAMRDNGARLLPDKD